MSNWLCERNKWRSLHRDHNLFRTKQRHKTCDFALTCPSQSRKLTPDIRPWLENPLIRACHNCMSTKRWIFSLLKVRRQTENDRDHEYIATLFYRRSIFLNNCEYVINLRQKEVWRSWHDKKTCYRFALNSWLWLVDLLKFFCVSWPWKKLSQPFRGTIYTLSPIRPFQNLELVVTFHFL